MSQMPAAIRRGLSNYVGFEGRASRPEYWWWVLTMVLVQVMAQIIDRAVVAPALGFDAFADEAGTPLSLILYLGLLLPSIAVSIRRLHDTGRSGWWLLIGLIPIVGALVLLYFYVQPSEEGDNAYGAPDPLD